MAGGQREISGGDENLNTGGKEGKRRNSPGGCPKFRVPGRLRTARSPRQLGPG